MGGLGDTLASVRERPEVEKHRTEATEATEGELVTGFELTNALFRGPHSIFLAKKGQPGEGDCGQWSLPSPLPRDKQPQHGANNSYLTLNLWR
jgi:hypothetical protein